MEFEDTFEQGYPAGEKAIEGFLIHVGSGHLDEVGLVLNYPPSNEVATYSQCGFKDDDITF